MLPSKPRALPVLLLMLCAACRLHAGIVVDGRLDEPEWQQAQELSGFLSTQPLTLSEPEFATRAWLHVDASGLYFAFRNQQPAHVERRKPRTRRDQQADADRVNLMVDFNGNGQTAWEFTVSLAGSIQDAVITDQRRFGYDWDGVWHWAVHEADEYWSVEIHLPWDIVPMSPAEGEQRRIGVFLSRVIQSRGLRYSLPPNEFDRPSFVADMLKLDIPDHARPRLDVVPYASLLIDRLAGDSSLRTGADLFWQPHGRLFVAATVNPDFAQVESDDLVVSFDATETLFSEKRPFFTAQQGLFRVQAADGTLLVNTRRIGGRPDAGPEAASDLRGAVLASTRVGSIEAGVLLAEEEDPEDASGRSFQVLRLRQGGPTHSSALLLGRTQRPELDRNAQVAAIEGQWRPSLGLGISAMLASSSADAPAPRRLPGGSGENRSGYAGFAQVDYAPGGRWQHRATLASMDRHLDLNDLGFQRRAGLHQLDTRSTLFRREFPDASPWQSRQWQLETRLARNDSGQALPGTLWLGTQARRRSTANLFAWLGYTQSGIDDLILRGNGLVHLPSRTSLRVGYDSPRAGRVLASLTYRHYQEGLHGWTRQVTISPRWFPLDTLTLGPSLTWTRSPSWLIWRGDTRLVDHHRQQWDAAFNADWYPTARQEIRLKMQWVGLNARARQGYLPGPDLRPQADQQPVQDLSLSTLGMQLRYRYQLAPLSDLYLVLARGGATSDDDAGRSGGELLRAGYREKTADQLLLKASWRF